jgi:hypothetical protein
MYGRFRVAITSTAFPIGASSNFLVHSSLAVERRQQERAADRNPQPVIRRFFSCIGYSAVVTWRSRADAPFDGTYVDAAPFSFDLAGNRWPTQSSRLDVLASLSVARRPGT